MKVYTVEEVAAILRVDYKTVLRLIERGLLKVLPGIRHKRITEEELRRYMDIRSTLSKAVERACTSTLLVTPPPVTGKPTKQAEINKTQTKGKAV